MPLTRPRLLVALLAVSLAGCISQPPNPSPAQTLAGSPTPLDGGTPTATLPAGPGASPTDASPGPAAPSPSAAPASPSPSPSATSSALPTASPSPSPSPSPSTSPTTLAESLADELQATLDEQLALRRIPGAAAVVSFSDGSRWRGVSGDAVLDRRQPVEHDTRFVVGSITKTFVAALVLQLVEEELLELDAPLSRWLPDYPRARRITLRQLLNHTSGVFNYFEHPRYESLVFGRPDHLWTPAEILAEFEREPYFAPGTGFHYSNTGFVLLGLVVEAATGSTLDEEFRRRFLEPLGLDQTYFQGGGGRPGAAHGYLRRPDGHRRVSTGGDYRPTTSAASAAWAAGGMVSTADDLTRWAEALYSGQVLSPESRAELMDHAYSPFPRGTYALGTRTRVVEGARAYGHTGSLRGYMAAMWRFPAEDVTVVVLTNLGRFDGNRLADSLVTFALPDSAPAVSPTPVSEPPLDDSYSP